ncbi:MAG: glycosyltransferase family 1 protein, partial [Clostridiales bacterium]|nr:glycosyltransferase family 1 protein [Clostridiales bacterium]
MNKVICMSTSSFRPYPTRKQQVMTRLRDSEILYFDPPISIIGPLKDPTIRSKLSEYRKKPDKPAKNITVYSLPPVLPFFNRFRIINRINQLLIASFVKKKAAQHGFDNAVLWTYSPTSCDLVSHMPHSALVYDCVDRHSGYKGQITPEVVDKMEQDLAKACDTVFATASGLYDTLKEYNEKTYLIPNGANYELFSESRRVDLAVPEDIRDLDGSVIGFIGTLQDCIDYDVIEKVAIERPEYKIVFVGKEPPNVNLGKLRELPNVRFCGLKQPAELPAYLARFNVCINPFRSGRLSKDVSPLKFYEYLATGKPIVSTPQPDQVLDYKDVVYIASDG